MKYRVEGWQKKDGMLSIRGFAYGKDPEQRLSYQVLDHGGNSVPAKVDQFVRNDVSNHFFHRIYDNAFGFSIETEDRTDLNLVIISGSEKLKVKLDSFFFARAKASIFVHNNTGIRQLYDKVRAQRNQEESYADWYKRHCASDAELAEQRENRLVGPLFSIVVPLYRTPVEYLNELIESVLNQTYSQWELCFADGSPDDSLRKVIDAYADDRIQYQYIGENKGISGNTNEAVKMAKGDWLVLCDHDDVITEDALYEFAKKIVTDPVCDCIYSDEDKMDGKRLYEPHFKPDYSPDLLRSNNYICHLFAVRKGLVDTYGTFRGRYDGAQDMDFILRMTEHARHVCHVPKILYHWRVSQNSTAGNAQAKLYAFEAGKAAVKDFYTENYPQYPVEKVTDGASLGIYHIHFKVMEQPLISVIIPNKDHTDSLDKAIRSVRNGNWKNLEFIVVENNSEKEETFAYYEQIQNEFGNVRVVRYEKSGFNYSALNNFGVGFAKGSYLLFLNNDVEMKEPDSLCEMMGYAQRSDVGIVGCQLIYRDGLLQHAGVVIGIGTADHLFKRQYAEATYFNRGATVRDCSAVTAAVMLTKRDIFEQVHGFDEALAVAFNDVDFCLKVREINKLVVYNPYAVFYHDESLSRGLDQSPEQRNRSLQESEVFTKRWEKYFRLGDPYYNPNLSLEQTDCSLRK